MKNCPVCKSRCFDDMEICYGCMYRFDGTKPAPMGPVGDLVPAPDRSAVQNVQMQPQPLAQPQFQPYAQPHPKLQIQADAFNEEESLGEGSLFEPDPAHCDPADPPQQVTSPAAHLVSVGNNEGFQAALPINENLFKTEYQLVISLQPRTTVDPDANIILR